MSKALRLMPGSTFAERFVVQRLLGVGSMGAVYLAEERATGALRALKVMSPHLLGEPHFAARFQQEARIGGTIASDHVVRVFDSGIDDATGLPWLAMEHLEGRTLARWFEEPHAPALAGARVLLPQIWNAVAAAHAARVIHRDLKPENIFLDGDPAHPRVKILDFGVAKILLETTTGATMPGLGAPFWSAPEQGKIGRPVRPSADVWALGLLTFRMLAGHNYWLTFEREGASLFDVAEELAQRPLPKASERAAELGTTLGLPPTFDAWFARCVIRDPAHRFQTAGDAWSVLASILG